MHLLVREVKTLDEKAPAEDLQHEPADILFLSMKIIILILCVGLFHTNAYGVGQKKPQHFDKVKRENRTNAENFKDYALIVCLQRADKKAHRSVNKDLSWSIMSYMQDWIDADLDNIKKTEFTFKEMDRLSTKYINNAGGIKDVPEGTAYASGCLDFYHSDELDKLMRYFVLNPNKTHR